MYLAGISRTSVETGTPRTHQPYHSGGGSDAFLAKFSSSGVRIWGTYYGGMDRDEGYSCVVDPSGYVYLAGTTRSGGMASYGAHQTTKEGTEDAFLVKFDSNGIRQWATYYGGTFNETALACALSGSDAVYLTGLTSSSNNIATPAAYPETHAGGVVEAFLVKFDSSGVRQWGTYFGGSGMDFAYSCRVGWQGALYLAGLTGSSGGIATSNAHQATFGGGISDAFLAKFDPNGMCLSLGFLLWGQRMGGGLCLCCRARCRLSGRGDPKQH